jgi:hemoglobin
VPDEGSEICLTELVRRGLAHPQQQVVQRAGIPHWQTVLFRDGGFRGDPIGKHARLVPLTKMGREQFDRWLALFEESVDELFTGENAGHIKRCAADMANVIHSKINAIPDERFDPAKLTPELRARYAAYRK